MGQALMGFDVESLEQENSEIPWRQIAAMRNILEYEHLGVDITLIWETLAVP